MIKLGAGLATVETGTAGAGSGEEEEEDEDIAATKAGVLSFKAPSRFHVLSDQKRYVPAVGDTVVGVISARNAEQYNVKLNATTVAHLPTLAFDGATKRNKPNLAVSMG